MADKGTFIVSLDFELYWGVLDLRTLQQYEEHLRGVADAVRAMLSTFIAHDVHVTWATVGFLFFKDTAELKEHTPPILPLYSNHGLSPYRYINEHEPLDSTCHFAPDLIELIRHQRGQEIGTHTFSHYYCLEDGHDIESFREDLSSAVRTARSRGIALHSLVFPRNQWNPAYLPILKEFGITCYRGNEGSWLYVAANQEGQRLLRRAIRFIDAYVNITGHHTYLLDQCSQQRPFNIPSSRFLRPYSKTLAFLDRLRLNRITSAMTEAAASHKVFHLWWHPHNFGTNLDQNMSFLKRIMAHFVRLKARYGMESLNMGEVSDHLDEMISRAAQPGLTKDGRG